jgi:hypothetical protein
VPKVEKITVSLPASLLARIEEYRGAQGGTRSEVVADWLWRGWRQVEQERMEDEYRKAYAEQPETAQELAWADMAADELFASNNDDWSEYWPSRPADLPPEHRAAG